MSLFVTGTDTDAGKTYVSKLILEGLRAQGVNAIGYKPISCGDQEDAKILAAASECDDTDLVNPVYLQTPVAPHVACMLENKTIDPASLVSHYQQLNDRYDSVIVEGAGGWEVPITADYRVADLASDLGLPVLVVAGNKLGALNHTLLTVQAIRARGLSCVGIVLNQLEDELDTAMITNKGVLADLAGVPLLDHIIHGQDFIDDDVIELAARRAEVQG